MGPASGSTEQEQSRQSKMLVNVNVERKTQFGDDVAPFRNTGHFSLHC